MLKKAMLVFVVLSSFIAVAQDREADTNQQLAARAHTICIDSKTYFMKRTELEKALLGRNRFREWGMRVTRRYDQADLVVSVARAPFQNNFPYTVTDRATETVIFGGEVNSLFGTVYDKIADDFLKKLQDVREGRTPGRR